MRRLEKALREASKVRRSERLITPMLRTRVPEQGAAPAHNGVSSRRGNG
jgi:hypothetical protein